MSSQSQLTLRLSSLSSLQTGSNLINLPRSLRSRLFTEKSGRKISLRRRILGYQTLVARLRSRIPMSNRQLNWTTLWLPQYSLRKGNSPLRRQWLIKTADLAAVLTPVTPKKTKKAVPTLLNNKTTTKMILKVSPNHKWDCHLTNTRSPR